MTEFGPDAAARIDRADRNETSSLAGDTLEDLLECNRAGPGESSLSLEQLWDAYCVTPPAEWTR